MKAILIGINKNLAGVQKGGDLQNNDTTQVQQIGNNMLWQ